MRASQDDIKSALAKLLGIDENERKVDWYDVLTLMSMYETKIKELSKTSEPPYFKNYVMGEFIRHEEE